jgi:hypothetical protein
MFVALSIVGIITMLRVSKTTTTTDGVDGTNGNDGADGADGIEGVAGVDGADGIDGVHGVAGVYGADGADGHNNLICLARTLEDGTIMSSFNCTVTRIGVGEYQYHFLETQLSNDYSIFGQIIYDNLVQTDTNVFVSNFTTAGFLVTTGLGDNGTRVDVKLDAQHSVSAWTTPAFI